jgi:hypothetical protein
VAEVCVSHTICARVLSFIRSTSGNKSLVRYNAANRTSFESVYFIEYMMGLEPGRIHRHRPRQYWGHLMVVQPGIADHRHRHLVGGP